MSPRWAKIEVVMEARPPKNRLVQEIRNISHTVRCNICPQRELYNVDATLRIPDSYQNYLSDATQECAEYKMTRQ